MSDIYVLPPTVVETFDEEKYAKNLEENGPFTNDAEKGEDVK